MKPRLLQSLLVGFLLACASFFVSGALAWGFVDESAQSDALYWWLFGAMSVGNVLSEQVPTQYSVALGESVTFVLLILQYSALTLFISMMWAMRRGLAKRSRGTAEDAGRPIN